MTERRPELTPMRHLSYWINTLANWQVRLCAALVAVLAVAMTAIILMQVFFRFVVYVPFPWSEELARFLMIYMAMFGSVIALRRGRHIGVRVLVERLPEKLYDVVAAPFVQVCMIGFLAVLFRQGVDLALRNRYQVSTALDVSMFWPYLAIPVGAAMMIIDIVSDMLHDRFPTPAGSSAKIATHVLDGGDENGRREDAAP